MTAFSPCEFHYSTFASTGRYTVATKGSCSYVARPAHNLDRLVHAGSDLARRSLYAHARVVRAGRASGADASAAGHAHGPGSAERAAGRDDQPAIPAASSAGRGVESVEGGQSAAGQQLPPGGRDAGQDPGGVRRPV